MLKGNMGYKCHECRTQEGDNRAWCCCWTNSSSLISLHQAPRDHSALKLEPPPVAAHSELNSDWQDQNLVNNNKLVMVRTSMMNSDRKCSDVGILFSTFSRHYNQ